MKKILSIVLSALMILSTLSVVALATPSEKCLKFCSDGVYFLTESCSMSSTNTIVSFDMAMAADSKGSPLLKFNDIATNGFAIAPTYVTIANSQKSFTWGDQTLTHWRHIEYSYQSGTGILSVDGVEVARNSGSFETSYFYMLGFPGTILIDNLSVSVNGNNKFVMNFEDEGTYNAYCSGDSNTTITTVPKGSYCDYVEEIIPNNIEIMFDGSSKLSSIAVSKGESYILGDLDGNSKLSGLDTILLRSVLSSRLTEYDSDVADVDENGRVNASDILYLNLCISGKKEFTTVSYGAVASVAYSSEQNAALLTSGSDVTAGVDATITFSGVDNSEYGYAVITYMTPNTSDDSNSSVATSASFGTVSELKIFDLNCDGKFNTAVIDISGISSWSGSSAVLRFFNAASKGDKIYLDSIIFCANKSQAAKTASERAKANLVYGIYEKNDSLGSLDENGNMVVRFDSADKVSCYASNGNNTTVSYTTDSADLGSLTASAVAGADPSVYLDLTSLGISANNYKSITYVYMIPSTVQITDPRANMYYVCGGISVPTGGYETTVIDLNKNGKYWYYTFDLSANSNWSGDIKGLRIDYFSSCYASDVAYIDSVIFSADTSAGENAGYKRIIERNASIDPNYRSANSIWNEYRSYHKMANTYEYVAGSDSDLHMYFRYSSKSALTARSLGDRMARAISNATGADVTCEIYSGFIDLKSAWDSSDVSNNVYYTLTYSGKSYCFWLPTTIIKDSSFVDSLDGTSADVDPTYGNTDTWYSDGLSGTDSVALPASSSSLAAHSNHENRLVKTPYGTFAVIPMSNTSGWATIGSASFTVYRIYDDGSTRSLGSYDFANHTSKPNIYYTNGKVYVIQADDQDSYASIFVAYFDPSSPNSDGSYNITSGRTNKSYSGGAAPGGYGYLQPMLDAQNNRLIVMACGGTNAGYLSWFIYSTASNSWTSTSKTVVLNGTYRHCYLIGYPDGNGGMYIVGGRDVLLSTLGLAGTVTGADYAWDEVNLFHFTDMNSTNYTMTHVAEADYTQQDRLLFPVTSHNVYGDMFKSSDGYLHIISNTVMHGTFHHDNKYSQMNYAIYDVRTAGMEPVEVYNKPIAFTNPGNRYTVRFVENTNNELYILAMPKDYSRCEIWKATDDLGSKFEMVGCDSFSSNYGVTTGLIIGNNRNGSICDNSVSCMYPTEQNGTTYRFFRIQLDS